MAHIVSSIEKVDKKMENFKGDIMDKLNLIIEDQKVIKQALFKNDEENQEDLEKVKNIDVRISGIAENVAETHPPSISSTIASSITSCPTKSKAYSKKKTKTCIIGDSISGNIDLKVVANTMDTDVVTAKAYSSLNDTLENEAKERTLFPEKSFENVIKTEVSREDPEILIIQAGSVDITNFKTGGKNPEQYGEYFKQQTIVSASNLFTNVANILEADTKIRKAIIMKQIPRYDLAKNDPKGIKAALSQLYNDTLTQLWLSSPLKDRLTVSNHRLECSGGMRESRYKLGRKFDGIHMFGQSGKKAYTESVLMILADTECIKLAPPRYFRRYHDLVQQRTGEEYYCPTQDTDWMNDKDIRYKHKPNPTYVYTIPTTNRFSTLNQGNY